MENIEIFDSITKSQLLIVDDSKDNLDAMNIILRKENYDVIMADSANAALKLLDTISPDLFLLDIEMPHMNGLELCRKIKDNSKFENTPVIFITGKSLTEDLVEGFIAGGVDYLVKPFNIKEFLIRNKTHIDLKYSREIIMQNSRKIEDYNKELIAINERLIELNSAKDRFLNVLRSDLQSAADYVITLMPEPYDNDNIKVSWEFHPSSQLSGDSFGYHWIDDKFVFFLVDVSGHGVKSALQSVSVLNILRSQSLRKTDFTKPQQVLTGLDKVFRIKEPSFLYFSIWYGCYSPKTQDLVYAGAGHPPAILWQNSEKRMLRSKNKLIAGFEGVNFKSNRIKIQTPACLYVYSDGAYEVKKENGKMYTFGEMSDYLTENANSDDRELPMLYENIQNINAREKLKDDFSIMKLSFKP